MDSKLKNALVRAGSLLWIFACVVGLIGGIGVTFFDHEWVMGVCVLALGVAAFPKVLSLKDVITAPYSSEETGTESESEETETEPVTDAESESESEETEIEAE